MTSAGVVAVVSPGATTGTLASCSCGDHSVTAISVPGETTKNSTNASHTGADDKGTYAVISVVGSYSEVGGK